MTSPSDSLPDDIEALRAFAIAAVAERDAAVAAAAAERAESQDPEVAELLERKTKADELRAQRQAAGQPWPEAWEAEYQRILDRLGELQSASR